jgi:hypothetical protein
VLLPSRSLDSNDLHSPGWVDRVLGADVLAVPVAGGDRPCFRCPSCGDHAGAPP